MTEVSALAPGVLTPRLSMFALFYSATAGVQGGVRHYKKQARDSAAVSPTYVTWVTTDPGAAYVGTLPAGGPLVETTILSEWLLVGS